METMPTDNNISSQVTNTHAEVMIENMYVSTTRYNKS